MIDYVIAGAISLALLFVIGSLVGRRLKRVATNYPTVGGDDE